MLVEMLKKNPTFQSFPVEQQELFARLAFAFEEDESNLFKSPVELAESNIGNRNHWQQFLSLDSVQAYIRQQMAYQTQIASRKGFISLQQEAKSGNVQAIKHLNELSGLLEQGDQNKIVILHQVNRPSIKKMEVQIDGNGSTTISNDATNDAARG